MSYSDFPWHDAIQTGVDLSFPNILDSELDTCDVISGPNIMNIAVVWKFPAHISGINNFRVILSGSQNCSEGNTVWFVPNETKGKSTECRATQNSIGDLKECLITCTCSWKECKYLHFWVQMPVWMRRTLGLCYFELSTAYITTELPFLIIWVSIHKSNLEKTRAIWWYIYTTVAVKPLI